MAKKQAETEILLAAETALKKRGKGKFSIRFERFVRSQTKDKDLEHRVWDRLNDELVDAHYDCETMWTLIDRLTKTELIRKIGKAARKRRR